MSHITGWTPSTPMSPEDLAAWEKALEWVSTAPTPAPKGKEGDENL